MPRCRNILLEAHNAVRRLEAKAATPASTSAAASAPYAGEDEDEDLVDVTEAAHAAKRARVAEETIDLDDSVKGETNVPPQELPHAAGGTGASLAEAPVKVKIEKRDPKGKEVLR